MIIEKTGKICEGLYSIGYHFIPAFLLMSTPSVLFDAGLTIAGPRYLEDLEEYLGNVNKLGYIFLTHSHYDHCGAAPFLKRNIPGLKIAAGKRAAEILKKPNAVKLMKSLNEDYEQKFRKQIGNEDISFSAIGIDVLFEDDDEYDLGGGWNIQVISTPGHTRDSVSYYIPKVKALIPGEATGVYDANFEIQSEFTSSYRDYIHSIEKLLALDIDIMLLPHIHILTGEDARQHIQKSLESAQIFKQRIDTLLSQFNGDREAVVNEICVEDYEGKQSVLQDKRSYLLNLGAKVKAVAEDR
jgi:glyoxylase-like metal-dependent hydrolase (beta-lactamase superfamily II)